MIDPKTGDQSVLTIANGSSNCLPIFSGPMTYGYSYSTQTVYYPVQIRHASNGFIVSVYGTEHVFPTVEALTEFLSKELVKK